FFSSRRRHTSFSRDWSSDVCSSDLCVDGDTARPILERDGAVAAHMPRPLHGVAVGERDRRREPVAFEGAAAGRCLLSCLGGERCGQCECEGGDEYPEKAHTSSRIEVCTRTGVLSAPGG